MTNCNELKHKFEGAWVKFCDLKAIIYKKDASANTHSIRCPVEESFNSMSLVSPITYNKGAAVLKQLVYLIGADNFFEGMKEYFATNKWKNTECKNFFSSIKKVLDAKSFPLDLDRWQKDWIDTAGVNQLEIVLDQDDQLLNGIAIFQTPCSPVNTQLRTHKIGIAFYYQGEEGSNKLAETKTFSAILNNNEELTYIDYRNNEQGGVRMPDGILLNYDDQDFVKVIIDDRSRTFFKKYAQLLDPIAFTVIKNSL